MDSNADAHVLPQDIEQLQQKALAFETELARRKKLEKILGDKEREFSDIVENAAEGLHRMDFEGRILWANRAELNLLGYRAEEYIGHPASEFHADPKAVDGILQKLRCGEAIHGFPARLICKDGAIRHVLLDCRPLMENGKLLHACCFTRDISERIRLEQELKERREQLASLDQRTNEFLALLSHELRNPLAPITTSLGLMRLRMDDMNIVIRSRQVIERQISLMTRLMDDLLDVSRITLGSLALRMEIIELGSIVERALELTRPLLDQLGHQLTIDLPDEAVTLRGDPARLGQALANLLENAARYTDAGGHIHLRARADAGALLLTVSDNGSGLAPDLLDRIFDPFIRGSNACGGLGVGLTLVRSIAELHGGQVQAASQGPGYGSEFLIRLPL